MAKKKSSTWNHSTKFKNRTYCGKYGIATDGDLKGERVFILSCVLKNGTTHNIAFESYQAAQAAGWVKK